LARACDDVRPATTLADEMMMKQTAKPSFFNPLLGLAVKGMWSTTFTQAVIEAIAQDDPEPISEPEAA
jgi:hypothetical protein